MRLVCLVLPLDCSNFLVIINVLYMYVHLILIKTLLLGFVNKNINYVHLILLKSKTCKERLRLI